MSAFRRIDSLLEGKSSDQLAREVAARGGKPKAQDQGAGQQSPNPPSASESPREEPRPLVMRTVGSATEGIYGLVLALSVIAVAWYSGPPDAGRVALSVLLTAVVFWLAHVYAYVLGRDVSQEQRVSRAELTDTLRENASLVEVVIPLLLALGLGEIHVISDTAAILAATVIASVELAAAGGYAALRHGAGAREVIASSATGLTLGLIIVLLKALVFTH